MLCLAASIFFGSPAAAAVGAVFFFLSLAAGRYGRVLIPLITKGAGIVQTGQSFEIPPSQDVIIGRAGGNFLATAFLSAQLYRSQNEADNQRQKEMGRMFENAISSAGFPFRVCAMISPLDVSGELEEIRAKRSVAESRLEKMSGKKGSADATRLEREIAMWNRLLERLDEGERPLEVAFYFSTTARGMTKEEAHSKACAHADELIVVLSSALSCEVARLEGDDMKRAFDWDFFGPSSADEMRDQLF